MALHTLDQIRVDSRLREEPDPMETLGTIFKILRQNRKLLLRASLCGALISGLVGFLTKPTFTAISSFIPPSNTNGSSIAAVLAGQLSSSLGGAGSLISGGKTQGEMYVGILKSETISRFMIKQFNLMKVYKVKKESRARIALAGHTKFEIGSKDGIISIQVTDTDPARARDIANGYLDALRLTNGSLALTENAQRRQFYEQRLALEKDGLANAEVALKRSQESTGFIAPVGQTQIELGAIAQIRERITADEVRLATLRSDESDDNPNIIRVQRELASLRSKLDQMQHSKDQKDGALSTAQVPAAALEYVRLAREVKYHETLFEIIAKQYEAARIEEARDPTLQILDRAEVPDTKSGPHRLYYIAGGFMAGFLLAACWTLYQYFSKQTQLAVSQ